MDALVIGCGLTGVVIARHLAEQGKKVVIWEQRNHVGGNMYDYVDNHGILVQKYGPHTFHTSSKPLYDYICRYEKWDEYKLLCGAVIDGICTPTPFNFRTIEDFYATAAVVDLKRRIRQQFGDRKTATVLEVLQCSDLQVRAYAQFLFDKDYSLYTAKQWGMSPNEIDISILNRVPLRFSYEEGYFEDIYQVMPRHSFTAFFEHLLAHENLNVELGVDALQRFSVSTEKKMLYIDGELFEKPVIYTGALDELFNGIYGCLPYRSLRFEWKYENIESKQLYPVVAYPQAEGFTRITEYKKLPRQTSPGTTYAVEYPLSYTNRKKTEPYYPVLTEKSQKQYQAYRDLATEITNLYPCGRLGDFKYYNMDQALQRALDICNAF